MNIELFIVPQLVLLGWFLLNRRTAHQVAGEHKSEDAMLQHLRDYLHSGYEATSRGSLLQLTQRASRGAFQCERQSFFKPQKAGTWLHGDRELPASEASLMAAVSAQGLPVDRYSNEGQRSELTGAVHRFMDQNKITVLVPVSDSMQTQWVWASHFASEDETPEVDALRAWQMAMQSVVERSALRLASAHLALLEKDADSATQVLRVLLPEAPSEMREGLEWAGIMRRETGEAPVLLATYPQGRGKVLVICAEVTAPGLAAVLLASALRGFCDSLMVAEQDDENLRPEKVMEELNEYIWRPDQNNNLSCVVALFDVKAQRVDYASAGEPLWLHVQAGGEVSIVASTGPGLGVADEINYLPQRIEISKGDSHLFLVTDVGPAAFGEGELLQKVQEASHVDSENIEDYVDDLAELVGQGSNDTGRSPGVVMLRAIPDVTG